YYTVLNGLAIVLQLFASGWLLRRLGAASVAGLWPLGVLVGAGASLVAPSVSGLVAVTRMYEAGLRISIAKTATEFFFFPLAPGLRRLVKTWIDAVVDRASDAIAGVLILALGAAGIASPAMLGRLTAVLAALWLGIAIRLRRAYVEQLST